MNELDEIVLEMLEQHPNGGESFFDALDLKVQSCTLVEHIYLKVIWYISNLKTQDKDMNFVLIVSGKFGRFFDNWCSTGGYDIYPLVVVNGGMRKGVPIDNLKYLSEITKSSNFVFIDDSFYSGKTRNAVKAEIERIGGTFLKTFVIYDGSPIKDPNVDSLYRYYDKHS